MNKPKVSSNFKAPTSYDSMFFGASNGVGILTNGQFGIQDFPSGI